MLEMLCISETPQEPAAAEQPQTEEPQQQDGISENTQLTTQLMIIFIELNAWWMKYTEIFVIVRAFCNAISMQQVWVEF